MSKTVWIVNRYAMPPEYEPRIRCLRFAHYLQKKGFNVLLFGASVMHNMDIDLIDDDSLYVEKKYDDLNFVHIKIAKYSKTSKFKRQFGDFQFMYRVTRLLKSNVFAKPDCIIDVSRPYLPNQIQRYANKNGIPFVREFYDVWPDNFIDYGIFSKDSIIMKLLYKISHNNIKKSDACVYSWPGYDKYIKEKKWDIDSGGDIDLGKIFYINNGVDLQCFEQWKDEFALEDVDLMSSKKNIIYMGSIRKANKVELLIKAAEHLKDRTDCQFLIYGDGPDRDRLIAYCKVHEIFNVIFKDKWINPHYVPYVITHSYINIMNYHSSDFARYGISSSKMFQYMAAGKPIVCNINIFKCQITENKIGIAKEFSNSLEYAMSISTLLDLPEDEYKEMGLRAKETAKEYDYEYLANKMLDVLNQVIMSV